MIRVNDIGIKELEPYLLTSEVRLYRYNEPKQGLFIAESAKVILRALDKGYEPISLLMDEGQMNEELQNVLTVLADRVPVYVSSGKILAEITGFNLTRGVLCAMRRSELPSIDMVCDGKHRVVVLDDVENPTNVGAIFRNAAALGIDAALLTKGCSDPLYRRAIRVSMGNVFQIPWTFFASEDYVGELHEMGFEVAALALDERAVDIRCLRERNIERLALVMGNEGYGITPENLERCDHTVIIPMANGVDSLNVASASGIAMWELGH